MAEPMPMELEENYTVTYQPQDDTSTYYHKTPVLPKTHAVIIHSSKDTTFDGDSPNNKISVGEMIGKALMNPSSMGGESETFKAKYHDVTVEMPSDDIAKDIRCCLKVVVIFSKNLFLANKRLSEEWEFITNTMSERHIECVVPVLHDLKGPSEIPPSYRMTSVMPAGLLEDFIKSNGQFYRPLVKQLSETVIVGPGDFTGIGASLAWGHFCGYLSRILPGLRERVTQTAKASSNTWELPRPFFLHPKMIAIIPKRGYHPDRTSLDAYDDAVRPLMKPKDDDPSAKEPVKAKYTEPMPGFPARDFGHNLHYATVGNKTYVFVAEIPGTLKTLTELEIRGYTNMFETEEHQRELHRFKARTEKILATVPGEAKDGKNDIYSEKRRQNISVLYYDEDKAAKDPHALSKLIAETIERDTTFHNAPWQG